MIEKVKSIISEELDVSEDQITLDTRITDDLGVDSISLINVIMALEDDLGIVMEEERLTQLVTVSDLVDYVNELVRALP